MKHIVAIFVVALLAGCFSNATPENTGLEGKLLPSFDIQLVDSTSYFNTANVQTGKPIAIFYFSPNCPYCKAQMDEIIEDMDKLKDIQFYVLTSYNVPEAKDFYNEYKLASYPNIVVGKDTANFLPEYFNMPGVPYMAIYGKDKKLHKTFSGRIYSQQLKAVAED